MTEQEMSLADKTLIEYSYVIRQCIIYLTAVDRPSLAVNLLDCYSNTVRLHTKLQPSKVEDILLEVRNVIQNGKLREKGRVAFRSLCPTCTEAQLVYFVLINTANNIATYLDKLAKCNSPHAVACMQGFIDALRKDVEFPNVGLSILDKADETIKAVKKVAN